MFLSVFDLFKIGIGPSSSHTVGPMVAARRFLDLAKDIQPQGAASIRCSLHGSLAFTGKGHATDRAIMLGLLGEIPSEIDSDRVDIKLNDLANRNTVEVWPGMEVRFDPEQDIVFDYGPALRGHANGMVLSIRDRAGSALLEETYYSIGGGFVQTEAERLQGGGNQAAKLDVPYPFATAGEMLDMGSASGLSVVAMKRANEGHAGDSLDVGLDRIWTAMEACMNRGLSQSGRLPGSLNVKRRAREIHEQLKAEQGGNFIQPHRIMDFLSVYAMAVNEENAAGGKVVTAPTNGAAGVIPAVIRYYIDHCPGADQNGIRTFLLAAAAIGGIIKHNASISGAEVGCQGEVGSASAMAAAGLCAALGGNNEQIENAAEIALEHHLGMTCDPVGGLVQIPCIERNAFGAVKAVTAASLALRGDGKHVVPLDTCIETMRQTGLDMSDRYKETSTGGLAVNVVEC
ncbi:MAG: L-serine ammonia-lyase [Rhizobiales bacterium]|nr:L-serine ammonia-lyase [Hyphomicrobiales bacterium]